MFKLEPVKKTFKTFSELENFEEFVFENDVCIKIPYRKVATLHWNCLCKKTGDYIYLENYVVVYFDKEKVVIETLENLNINDIFIFNDTDDKSVFIVRNKNVVGYSNHYACVKLNEEKNEPYFLRICRPVTRLEIKYES